MPHKASKWHALFTDTGTAVQPRCFAHLAGVPNFGPVGRLDFDTSGVLLFTDDYKLKKAISSPT